MSVVILVGIFTPGFSFFKTPGAELVLTQGERVDGADLSSVFDSSLESEQISLPFDARNHQFNSSEHWFRFRFEYATRTDQPISIYLPTVRQNAALYLNGRWVAQGGDFEPYLARLWNHPQLYTLPSGLLNDSNTLTIRLVSHRPQVGYLSEVFIGDPELLHGAWQWRYAIKVTWLEITSILLIVIGLINLYLWTLRKNESFYLWYSLAALSWGARGILLVWPVIPITDELRVLLRLLTLGYGIVFVVLFNQRYFGYKNRWFDIGLFIYCVPAVIPMFFMNMDQLLFYGHQVWVRGNLILGIVIAVQLMVLFLKHHKLDAAYLLYSGLPLLMLGFRDMLVLTDRWSPENGFLINHATPPALIIAMWFILRRLSNSLEYARHLNVTLEQRVAESRREVVASYQKQEQLQQQKLLSDERERIMRDMHDGLGGHLIGIKSLMDNNQPKLSDINNYVERALVDLRLVINSLDPGSQRVSSLLGSLRNRWQRAADNRSCTLEWRVASSNQGRVLGPDKTLQLMRILEEAFTNTIKHGDIGIIELSSGRDEVNQTAWIQLKNPYTQRNDQPAGRGLANMQQRASKIGAEISFLKDNDEFLVRVELPLVS